MSDAVVISAGEEGSAHAVLAHKGREYLFSRCSSCDSLHKRQEVVRVSASDIQKWKDADRYPNWWATCLGAWPLWVILAFCAPLDGNFHVKYWWPITAASWLLGAALGVLGYRSARSHSERKSAVKNEILVKYKISASVEEVATVDWLKDFEWESEPGVDEDIRYALAANK